MTPIMWLEENARGFRDLPDLDREAIFQFTLLWSLFEATASNDSERFNSRAILNLVREWAEQGRLKSDPFEDDLEYFRSRFFENGRETARFNGLRLRPADAPELVRSVLARVNQDPADCIGALLVVVYRLRNNLFHGTKWAHGIREQRNNFTHANTVLMNALTLVDS